MDAGRYGIARVNLGNSASALAVTEFRKQGRRVNMLILVCEVCTTPKMCNEMSERLVMMSKFVQCPYCKQLSKVPQSLRDEIKRHLESKREMKKE